MTVPSAAPVAYRSHIAPIEFRSEPDGKLTAVGYAAVFNSFSQNLGGFVEQVAPGAFTRTVGQGNVVALFNHDPNWPLGRMSNGTLRLKEDDVGLAYEIDLPDDEQGRSVARMLQRRDVIGSSFGFRTIESEPGETDQGFPLVTLTQLSLRDVGPVTFPAYTDTEASLRCLAEWKHLDLDAVRSAAERNELRSLLNPPAEDPESQTETETRDADARETPTVARLLRSFGAY
jgi:HK97 family phage prohead protease